MDQHSSAVIEKRILKTVKALNANNLNAEYVKTKEELMQRLESLVPEGSVVAAGGSMTLDELGLLGWLGSGRMNFLDRYAPGLTPEESGRVMREAFFADSYFSSANAITEAGELYNIDGNGNRVAAIAFGPKQVIIIAGYNKIVTDIAAAQDRLDHLATPANAIRLGITTTGCAITGQCTHCRNDKRLCCQYVKTGFSRDKNRFHVFILPMELGY